MHVTRDLCIVVWILAPLIVCTCTIDTSKFSTPIPTARPIDFQSSTPLHVLASRNARLYVHSITLDSARIARLCLHKLVRALSLKI